MENSGNSQQPCSCPKCVKTLDSQELANARTLETTTKVTQKEKAGSVSELVQLWKYWSLNIVTDTGLRSKIDSWAKDESQSGVVICRGVERLVTELSLDCTEPLRSDASTLSVGRLGAFIPWNVQSCGRRSLAANRLGTAETQRRKPDHRIPGTSQLRPPKRKTATTWTSQRPERAVSVDRSSKGSFHDSLIGLVSGA